MKSLGDLFRDSFHYHAGRESPSADRDTEAESPYLLLGQKATSHHKPASTQVAQNPTEQEIRDYLGSLAKAYDLPADLVQAAAMTESTFDPHKIHHNPHTSSGMDGLSPPQLIMD